MAVAVMVVAVAVAVGLVAVGTGLVAVGGTFVAVGVVVATAAGVGVCVGTCVCTCACTPSLMLAVAASVGMVAAGSRPSRKKNQPPVARMAKERSMPEAKRRGVNCLIDFFPRYVQAQTGARLNEQYPRRKGDIQAARAFAEGTNE